MGATGLYPSFSFDGINALLGICKYLCIEERPGRIIVLSLAEDRPDGVGSEYGTLSQGTAGTRLSVFLHIRKFRILIARCMSGAYLNVLSISSLLSKVSCCVGSWS